MTLITGNSWNFILSTPFGLIIISFIPKIGYCTNLCCQDGVEELCYSPYTGFEESCALISEGGCPCPEGQVKCGASTNYAGKSNSDNDIQATTKDSQNANLCCKFFLSYT